MSVPEQKWVCGWGTSCSCVRQSMCEIFEDTSFRYEIFPTMPASAMRLHFSNRYGGKPAYIGGVFLARSADGHPGVVDSGTNVRVTFGGRGEAVIEPGGELISDAADFTAEPGVNFAVSIYIRDCSPYMTGHSTSGPYIKKFLARGDHIQNSEFPPDLIGDAESYVYLHSIDFLTATDSSAVVAFGDSITAMPWPDCLARILHQNGITNRSVIRQGISGGRILRGYNCRVRLNQGEAGVRRFERDVTCAGADSVLILHGINDICHPGSTVYSSPADLPTAGELIEGFKKYIEIAHSHGLKIYISTIMPAGERCTKDGGERERIRLEVNEWIRSAAPAGSGGANSSGGVHEHDGLLDFDAAVRNPAAPSELAAEFDSGDHLHPNFAGSKKLAESVPLEYLIK